MFGRPIVTLDTSAINRLAKASEASVLAGVTSRFHCRLTFTNLSEVIANSDSERRRGLTAVCKRLLSAGDCIEPQHEIIRKMIDAFVADREFEWTDIYVRFPEAETELARTENFEDGLSQQEREDSKLHEATFRSLFAAAKEPFDRLFATSPDTRPRSLDEFVPHLQVVGGAFWKLGSNLCTRASRKAFDESMVRHFVARCEPFNALLLALFAAQYERCIRPHTVQPSLRSSRNDTFMAVCLSYCHHFVTDDARQLACFRAVSRIAGLDVELYSYNEFFDAFLLSKSIAMGAVAKVIV